MNLRVKSVSPLPGYKLLLEFTSGERGQYDCTPVLEFGVFKELKDAQYFRRASVMDGTVVWPHEQDICPDTLYQDSVKV